MSVPSIILTIIMILESAASSSVQPSPALPSSSRRQTSFLDEKLFEEECENHCHFSEIKLGDGFCDIECNILACGYDKGDCFCGYDNMTDVLARALPECEFSDGKIANKDSCLCGTACCTSANATSKLFHGQPSPDRGIVMYPPPDLDIGLFCRSEFSLCSKSAITVEDCVYTGGNTANEGSCRCGSTLCRSAESTGLFCSYHLSICSRHTNNNSANACSAKNCEKEWIGDEFCDAECNNAKCGFDSGDCRCTFVDGRTANKGRCRCGSKEIYNTCENADTTGLFCVGELARCYKEAPCVHTDGKTANEAICSCGPVICESATTTGLYCRGDLGLCAKYAPCLHTDGNTANEGACTCEIIQSRSSNASDNLYVDQFFDLAHYDYDISRQENVSQACDPETNGPYCFADIWASSCSTRAISMTVGKMSLRCDAFKGSIDPVKTLSACLGHSFQKKRLRCRRRFRQFLQRHCWAMFYK